MNRTYQYRCLPKKGQAHGLDAILFGLCQLYNAAKEFAEAEGMRRAGEVKGNPDDLKDWDKQKYWKAQNTARTTNDGVQLYSYKTWAANVRYNTLTLAKNMNEKELAEYCALVQCQPLNAKPPGIKPIGIDIWRGAVKRLDLAMQAFNRRRKEGAAKRGYPRWKAVHRYNTIDLPAGRFKLEKAQGQWAWLSFKGCPGDKGRLRVYLHRPIPSECVWKNARITKDSKGWRFSLVLELPTPTKTQTDGEIGVDVGLDKFLTTNEEEDNTVPNPRFLRKKLRELRTASRCRQRRQKPRGQSQSNRFRKATRREGRCHTQVANARKTFHFQTAAKLVARAVASKKVLAVEDLNVKGLARGLKNLRRPVHDAGWAAFIKTLEDKAESAGIPVIKVPPRLTSQACSGCGTIVRKGLTVRTHRCPGCGLVLDRDHNAAINIAQLGRVSNSGACMAPRAAHETISGIQGSSRSPENLSLSFP